MGHHFTIRHYLPGEEAKLARLINLSRGEEDGFVVTEGMIRDEWSDPRLSLDEDTWVALDDAGEYVAVAEVWFEGADEAEEREISRHIGFTLHPDYRANHTSLLDTLLERAIAHARSRPMDPEKRYYLRAWSSANDEWKQAWIISHGFDSIHCGYTLLHDALHSLPTPPVPAGAHLEKWSPERDYDLWRAVNECFQDDESFVPLSWEEWHQAYHEGERVDATLWRVAIDDESEEVAGFALCEVVDIDPTIGSPMEGWITDLAVNERWREQPLREALGIAALHALREAGVSAVLMGIDTDEPASSLEEHARLGFRVLRGSCTYHRALDGR